MRCTRWCELTVRCAHVQMEELKLLSTAERLGLLSLAEKALTSDPGAISSASILPLIAGVGEPQSRPCTIHRHLKAWNSTRLFSAASHVPKSRCTLPSTKGSGCQWH